jgi:hypothetical protein
MINQRLNQVATGDMQPEAAVFGNCAMLFVGDMLQLPPVCGSFPFQPTPDSVIDFGQQQHVHLFRSIFHPVFLTVSKRQEGDSEFAAVLGRVRVGRPTSDEETRKYQRDTPGVAIG